MADSEQQDSGSIESAAGNIGSSRRRGGKLRKLFISVIRVTCLSYAAILLALVLMETRIVYPAVYMADSQHGGGRSWRHPDR